MPTIWGHGDACELECVKKDTLQEFEGPVKIIIVEPPGHDLENRVWESAIVNFANLLIGAVVVVTLYFSCLCRLPIFISAHIAACTTGFQLLLPSALLMLNPYFGGSTQLKNQQRKSQHAYLTHLSLIFGVTGALHILAHIIYFAFPINPHTITGLAVILFAFPTFFMGPLLYYADICTETQALRMKKIKYVHAALGLTTFVLSSVCMCTSYTKPSFQRWAQVLYIRELPWVLTIFTVVYNIIVIRSVGWQMRYHNMDETPK